MDTDPSTFIINIFLYLGGHSSLNVYYIPSIQVDTDPLQFIINISLCLGGHGSLAVFDNGGRCCVAGWAGSGEPSRGVPAGGPGPLTRASGGLVRPRQTRHVQVRKHTYQQYRYNYPEFEIESAMKIRILCNAALHHCGKWYRIRQKVNQDLFDTVLLSRSSEIFKFTTYGNFLILMSQENFWSMFRR